MNIQHHTYRPIAVSSLFTAHNSQAENYAFASKERDTETGLSVTSLRSVSSLPLGHFRTSSNGTRWLRRFGARYYSSDLSIWLSVDPMVDKYPSFSPYVYCANNPVKLTDPDGRWVPGLDEDNNIVVTQEDGDDLSSFKAFMGSAYSDEDISIMYGSMQDGQINLTKTYGKEFQMMTDAINEANNNPDFEKNENYNCWGASIAVTKNIKPQGNGPMDIFGVGFKLNSLGDFDNALSNGYTPSNQSNASVGKTVLRYGMDNNNGHGAVYLGTDRGGNEYVFTKNGWRARPTVMTTEEMLSGNPSYGNNCDRGGLSGQGYYNRKARRVR